MDEVYRQVEELIDVILALAPARAPRAEVTADAARSDG